MAIDFNIFLNWVKSKFPPDNIKINKDEIRLNSIFADEDKNHHLYCHPAGGKNKVDLGVFHCFKSEQKGTLAKLVMRVEGCSFITAIQILKANRFDLTKDVVIEDSHPINDPEQEKDKIIQLPPHTVRIQDAPNFWKTKALNYLKSRKMPWEYFYICIDGDYKNRIVIPYYNESSDLIYYNARTLLDKFKPKYMGPPKTIGVGKEDVLFMYKKPEKKEKIYITEGEIDSLTLNLCGYYSAACGGKSISDKQILKIMNNDICLCLDTDDAGENGLEYMYQKLKNYGKAETITVVRPPEDIKDWNKFYTEYSDKIINAYIKKYEKNINEIKEFF